MRKRLQYFDGLKGLLAICVVCFHYYFYLCNKDASLIPIPITSLFTEGWLAVEFFFMISGFLMAGTYCNAQFDMSFMEYISKKLIRILPCFILSNIIIIIESWLDVFFVQSSTMSSVNLWKAIMSCMPISYGWVSDEKPYNQVGWFISVLVLCYIIYFAFLKIRNKYRGVYIALCVFMVFFGWSAHQMNFQFSFIYRDTARGYICFFAGVLLYHLFNKRFNKKLISVFGLIVIGILMVLAHKYRFAGVFGHITFSFSFIIFPILLLSVTTLTVLQKILMVSPLLYLGKISMSVYLMHLPVIRGIQMVSVRVGGIDVTSKAFFVFFLIIVFAVAILEYELFEKHIFPKYIPKLLELLKKDT